MFLKKSKSLAIVDFDNKHINYEELIANVKYYTEFIKKEGTEEHIILMAENRKEWIYFFFAMWNNKLAPVVIDALSTKDELKYFIKDSDSRKIIVSNSNIEIAKSAVKELREEDIEVEIINIDSIEIDNKKIEELKNDDLELKHPENDETAVMLYTSGTTSAPKGVLLSYNNIISEIGEISSVGLDDKDGMEQSLGLLPFHHIFPLMTTCLYFLYHSYSIALVPKLSSASILEVLKNNRVTFFCAVPRIYKLFYQNIKSKIDSKFITRMLYKLAKGINSKTFSKIIFSKVHKTFGGNIKTLIAGGAKSQPDMIEFFRVLGFDYCEGYGLTETSPMFLVNTKRDTKIGTVGRKTPNVEIKVVDEELWVKGPIVMKGYYKKEDKTKEAITEDGWFKTGDVASIDKDGYVTIEGRKNSMLVLSNGKNISPEGLEEKLLDEFKIGVKEVAILNNNDKLSAIIVVDTNELKKNKILNLSTYVKDAVEFYNSKVHNYEKILDYKIKEEELPKTRIGKVRRFMLNELYNSSAKTKKEKLPEPDLKEYKILKEYIKRTKNIEIEPDDKFEIEVGLDSLDLVELIAYIENNFGITLNEEIILNENTPRKLAEYLAKNSSGYSENDINWNEIINKSKHEDLKQGYLIKIAKPIFYILFKIYFRLSVKGKKNIPQEQKIYIANHESFIDALALMQLVDNDTYFLAIDIYFKNKFMQYIAKHSNIILINIDNNVKDSIQKIANVLKQGKNVFIFPEGTRTKDGELSPFKKIFAILAKELNINIECLKIDGAFEAYSRHTKFPKPKKLTVKYLGQVKPNGTYEEIVEKSENMYKGS